MNAIPNPIRARLDFRDATTAISFNLEPTAAVDFFKAKGLKPTFAWQDLLGTEHQRAFTVAKMLDVDLLADVHASLEKAMAQGQQFGAWRQQLQPLLEAKGWWGNQPITDPKNGVTSVARLGTPARLQTIFRTNMQASYAVGQWHSVQVNKTAAPLLMYDAIDDHRTRPAHKRLDGLLLPVDHPFWRTHAPPNGWNCRCGVVQMTPDEARDLLGKSEPDEPPPITLRPWVNPRTGKTLKVPTDLDPGWDHNPGDTPLTELDQLLREKVAALPGYLRRAVAAAPLAADPRELAAAGKAYAQEAVDYNKGKTVQAKLAAQAELDEIAATNPAYLGAALKKVSTTKAGAAMGAPELLAAVKAEAAKVKQAALLANYKQKVLQGKQPNAAQLGALMDLPPEQKATFLAALDAEAGIAEVLANPKAAVKWTANTPKPTGSLHGVKWKKAKGPDFENGLAPHLEEPPLNTLPGKKKSAGVIMLEDDGRVWVFEPKDHYGETKRGLPKGGIDKDETGQQAALREVFEETGLQAQITGVVGDVQGKKTITRFYIGRRTGGLPTDMGDEAWSVRLLPAEQALEELTGPEQKAALAHALKLQAGEQLAPLKVLSKAQQAGAFEARSVAFNKAVEDYIENGTPIPVALDTWYATLPEAAKKKVTDLGTDASPSVAPAAAAADAVTPASPAASAPLVFDDFKQVGGQGGSNPGGLYEHRTTGERWYIKTPATEDHARNEALAARLYAELGIDVPTVTTLDVNGRVGVASRIVDSAAKDAAGLRAGTVKGVGDGFVADAWLANWDVVGLSFDNMLVAGGKAVRLDTGGALLYRAQGTKKGAAFGDKVAELDSLKDASTNPQSAAVFKHVTDAQMTAGAERLAALSDDKIDELVNASGLGTSKTRAALAKTLKARKADILKRLGVAEVAGKAKVDPEALREALEEAAYDARIDLDALDAVVIGAIKGIATRAGKGVALEQKDLDRVRDAAAKLAAFSSGSGKALTDSARNAVLEHYVPWVAKLEKAVQPGSGAPAQWDGAFYTKFVGELKADPERVTVRPPRAPGSELTGKEINDAIQALLGVGNARRASAPGFERLNSAERGAIHRYTQNYYHQFNKPLRNRSKDRKALLARDALNQALAKATPYRGWTARGMHLSGQELDKFLADARNSATTGAPVTFDAFSSTSYGDRAAFGGNITLRMLSATGVKVEALSAYPSEREVLFRAGSKFHVEDVVEASGRFTITLTEVEPK